MQAWPGGHRLKEAQRALQVRAVKGVAKNQKSAPLLALLRGLSKEFISLTPNFTLLALRSPAASFLPQRRHLGITLKVFNKVGQSLCLLPFLVTVVVCSRHLVSGKRGVGGPDMCCFKKLNAPYKSGSSKAWLKIKNPKAPAATRAADGTF